MLVQSLYTVYIHDNITVYHRIIYDYKLSIKRKEKGTRLMSCTSLFNPLWWACVTSCSLPNHLKQNKTHSQGCAAPRSRGCLWCASQMWSQRKMSKEVPLSRQGQRSQRKIDKEEGRSPQRTQSVASRQSNKGSYLLPCQVSDRCFSDSCFWWRVGSIRRQVNSGTSLLGTFIWENIQY